MKKYIKSLALVASCAIALTACDDNAWNDKLDGFKESQEGGEENVQSFNYTLTPDDYSLLAKNATNKALAGDADAKALAAVGTQGFLTDVITAEKYVPALLNDVSFPYFTLGNGSAINVTYRLGEAIPEQVNQMAAAGSYTVSEADYIEVWESDVNYVNSFAPSHTAASSLPKILKAQFPDAAAGDYVVVNYNAAQVDPVFNVTEEPGVKYTNVLGDIAKDDAVEVIGYVAAVSTQGPIVADASGAVFVYSPTNNADLNVGDQVKFSGTVDTYNYAFQIAKGATLEVVGTTDVNATPKNLSGAEITAMKDQYTATGATPMAPVYATISGKVTKSESNGRTYINIILDGTEVQGSPYGASAAITDALTDGADVTLEGYAMAFASKGKYLNMVITKLNGKAMKPAKAPAIASVNENAIYGFNGSAWTPAANTAILSHADYQAMGQKYDNLSEDGPELYLATYMKMKFPYAAVNEAKMVVYNYYSGSTSIRCQQYVFDGNNWNQGNVITNQTLQFVKNKGVWNYDPSVVITLPAGRGIAFSAVYYQTCVDWVKNNVPDGAAYVSSYGNNEYYCGTSAYQNNVDLRASAAKIQYPGYDSMTDEEVVALEKKRFETEVMPAALAILHPDMAPVEGLDVTLTLNFFYYTGSATEPATAVWKVVGKAKFEFVSCTWND